MLPSSMGERERKREAVAIALRKFDKLRLPRLREIYIASERMSGMKADMNVIAELSMYAAIWLMTRIGRVAGGGEAEKVWGYDLVGEVNGVCGGEGEVGLAGWQGKRC